MLLKKKILLAATCCILIPAQAQQPAFFHLSTAEGLSDNLVNALCRDKNGILWIGTSDGLNSFDGNSITTYYTEQFPALGNNQVYQVVCDNRNRVWLRTAGPTITMLDEKRRFHSFTVGDSSDRNDIRLIIQTKKAGLVVLKGNKQYSRTDTTLHSFQHFPWKGDSLIPANIRSFSYGGDDKIIFCGNGRLVMADYKHLSIPVNMPFEYIVAAAQLNDHELVAFKTNSNSLFRVNLAKQKITREYKNLQDQYNQPIAHDLRDICRISDTQLVITSRFSGAYLFDITKERVYRWHHDPVNNQSIGGDNTYKVQSGIDGYVFITTQTSGVHYFNIRQPAITWKPFFSDERKNIFDGFIQAITTDENETVWLGTQDRLIQWNRETGHSRFIKYALPGGMPIHKETIRALLVDPKGNLWVGTSRYGIILLDRNQKTTAHLSATMTGNTGSLPSNWINAICAGNDGNNWIATWRGICKVNIHTRQIENFSNHPVLAPLTKVRCNTVWFDRAGRLWVGTEEGAWCYDKQNNSLKQYTTHNGLSHNRVLAFNEDKEHNIYIGTAHGLTVIKQNGRINIFNRNNGLRNDKCEGILRDEEGFIWIGNLNCILRFDPVTEKFAVFEEGVGFMHAGFRMRSCYKNKEGELFWGSDKGLNYFSPGTLHAAYTPLQPAVNALYTNDTIFRVTGYDSLLFPHNSSAYTFNFSSGELSGTKKVQFLYRLAGYESNWNPPLSYGQATYRRLDPGTYRFELKASRDGKNWYNSPYPVVITILKPWWQQTWFRISVVAALAGIFYLLLHYREKRKKAAAIQKMIAYFTRSGYEHSSVDDILWDISHNCISRLDFDDCVIYLLDPEKNVLVQKAAYGPKSPAAFEILNPIEIPVGKGIVGEVALTGKAALVNDTSKHSRYIVDDEKRLSEITVPLVHEGNVIGVIDSEHKRRHFFKKYHLQALQTIASICSAKISKAMAVDAMKKSRMEVMELNIKMVESKFLNLRLQMNPHFLFNSLSSIQNLIVSQQTTRAYKYLTLFSNFLRSLLNHADKNFITLDEEVSILTMYIQLESLRFDKSFQYEINVDETLSNDEVLVPSLMVQPFAENAIWHGLMHKKGDKKLSINFTNNADEYLTCTIEDNGIGRYKAMAIRKKKISSVAHESKGINIIQERLTLLQQKTGKPAKVEIEDLLQEDNEPAGTKIIITIPFYNPEEV